ncbi:MAG: hypothetical protein R2867_37985 [Caldilineaceae bacterium]
MAFTTNGTPSMPTRPQSAPKPLAALPLVDVNTLDAVLNSWAGQVDRVFGCSGSKVTPIRFHAVRFLAGYLWERAGERTFRAMMSIGGR